MAKVQHRRTVSIRGATYAQLRERCDERRQSMSAVVERLIRRYLASMQHETVPSTPSNEQHGGVRLW